MHTYRIDSTVSAVTPVVVWSHDGLSGRSIQVGAYFADRSEGDVPRFNVIRRDSGVIDARRSERGVKWQDATHEIQSVCGCTFDTASALLDSLLDQAQAQADIDYTEATNG